MKDTDIIVSVPKDTDSLFEGFSWMLAERGNAARIEAFRKLLPDVPPELLKSINPMTIYTERLLACLVSVVQPAFRDMLAGDEVQIRPCDRLTDRFKQDYVDVKIPIRAILSSDKDENYTAAAAAAAQLQFVVFPKIDGSRIRFKSLIVETDIDSGYILFSVSKEVWAAIVDISDGFRRTDFWVVRAISHRIPYRLYKIIAGQRNPLMFRISLLAKQLSLPKGYYKSASAFENKVLKKAKAELDAVSPWSFDYKLIRSKELNRNTSKPGPKGKDMVHLFPVHIIKNERSTAYLTDSVPGHSVTALLDPRIKELLKEGFGMQDSDINNWRELLLEADSKIPGGLYAFIVSKYKIIEQKSDINIIGYLHNVIDNEIHPKSK